MGCKIRYKDNKIDRVLDAEGKDSKLFLAISSIPTLSTKEALDIYENVYSDKISEDSEISFRAGNRMYFNYKEALRTGDQEIEIFIGGSKVGTTTGNSNPNTKNGLINDLILKDLINDQAEFSEGEQHFIPQGNTNVRSNISSAISRDLIKANNLGKYEYKEYEGGDFTIEEQYQPLGKSYKELSNRFDSKVSKTVLRNNLIGEILNSRPVTGVIASMSEQELREQIKDLLNNLGIELKSIEDYEKQYKNRVGSDISAEAFADIANSVIAFKGDDISIEVLMEETFHFLIEALPIEELAPALVEVTDTTKYTEISEHYRDLYTRTNPNMSVEEIETLVQKEVLAQVMVEQFRSPETTIKNEGLITRVIQAIRNLLNRIVVTESSRNHIATLTNQVGEMILTRSLSEGLSLRPLQGRTYMMFSAQPSNDIELDNLYLLLKDLAGKMSSQERFLSRNKELGSPATVKNLESTLDRLETEATIVTAELAVVNMLREIRKKVDYLDSALTSAESNGRGLNADQSTISQQLTSTYRVALEQVSNTIRDLKGLHPLKELIPKIENTTRNIGRIEGRKRTITKNVYSNLVDEIVKQRPDYYTFTEQEIQDIKTELLRSEEDINLLYSYYGQLTHASDPALNLLGNIFGNMQNEAQLNFFQQVKSWTKDIEEKGFTVESVNKIMHRKGKYVANKTDKTKAEARIVEERTKAHVETLIEKRGYRPTAEEIEIISRYYSDPANTKITEELGLKDEYEKLHYREVYELNTQNLFNRMMKSEYYTNKRELYEELDIQEDTRIELNKLSARRGELLKRTTEGGVQKLTPTTKAEAEDISNDKKRLESVYGKNNAIKDGLSVKTAVEYHLSDPADKDGYREYEKGMFVKLLENPSREAIIAYDLIKIKEDFKNKAGETSFEFDSISDRFWTDFEAMEFDGATRRELVEFFTLNVGLNFNQDFWNNLDPNNVGNSQLLKDFILETSPGADYIKNYNKYTKLINTRSTLIKQYRDTKNSTNYIVGNMDSSVLADINEMSEDIDELSKLVFTVDYTNFSNERREEKGQEQAVEREGTPNDSWYKDLADNGVTYGTQSISAIRDYAKKHMTRKRANRVEEVVNYLTEYHNSSVEDSSKTQYVRKTIDRVLGEGTFDIRSNTDPLQLALDFTESNLEVYYKALAPTGVNSLMRDLWDKNSTRPVIDIIKELESIPGVKLTNHYSFYENGEFEFLNKAYESADNGEAYQIDLVKNPEYRDDEFHTRYGITYDSDGLAKPTSNLDEYSVWESTIDFHKTILDKYHSLGARDVYKKLGVPKTTLDKLHDITKGKSIKAVLLDSSQDFIKYRLDELEEGEMEDGKSVYKTLDLKVIPKMYLQDLEVEDITTSDYVYAMMLAANSAHQYSARHKYSSDAIAVRDQMLERGNIGGKSVEASNTYKMANSYIDSNLYGINEVANKRVTIPMVGEVDLAKVLSKLHNIVRWKNLANNVIVPLTSYFTARIQFFIESMVEQYVDRGSVRLARKKFNGKFINSMGETFNVNSKSELNIIGEFYSAFDLSNRFENTNKTKLGRAVAKLGFGLHTVANFEPLSMAMLSNIYGHRIYNGKVVDYMTFKKMKNAEGLSTSQVKSEWRAIENKSMMEYITVTKDGQIKHELTKFRKDTGLNSKEASELYFRTQNTIRNRGKKLVERIDGNIREEERTVLQRNAFGKYMMTHKGWMSIALSTRFKGKHFSMQTLQEEEGVYRSAVKVLYRAMTRAFTAMKGQGNIRDVFNDLSETEGLNMKRFGIEMATASTVFMFAIIAGAMGDRDDKKDILTAQFLAYMMERMSNETASQQLGLGGEIYNTIKSPIVGLQQIGDIFNFSQMTNFEELPRGRYKGLTGFQAYVIGNLSPLKQAYLFQDASNMQYQRNAYKHYNDIEDWQALSWLLDKETAKAIVGN